MHTFILQDFTTIRGAYNVTITQSEDEWLDLEDYEDVTLWLDIREVTFATSMTSLTFALQTAPIRDEVLFMELGNGSGYSQTSTTPPTAPIVRALALAGNPSVPLGRFVRWQLVPVAGTAGVWDATFRVLFSANRVGGGFRRGLRG